MTRTPPKVNSQFGAPTPAGTTAPRPRLDVRASLAYTGPVKRRQLWVVILLAAIAAWVGWWLSEWRREHRYDAEIEAAARRYGVDAALLRALAWQESRFHAQARGRAGELGLMQLGEYAAQEWADSEGITSFEHEHALDPRTNALAAAYYLRKLLRRYAHTDDPLPYALADYNAGRTRVLRWLNGPAQTNSAAFLEQIDFPATQRYVRSVMNRFRHYGGRLPLRVPPD